MDNLKIVMAVMVILQDAAFACGAAKYFPVNLFVMVNRVYLAGFFFFLSGYLSGRSLEKKTPGRWISDRMLKLSVPAIAGMWLLRNYPGEADVAGFLELLLLFDFAYLLCRKLVKPGLLLDLSVPAPRTILLFAIGTGIVCWLMGSLVPGIAAAAFVFRYAALFLVGAVAYQNNWPGFLPYRTGKRLGLEVVLLALVFPAMHLVPHLFDTGFHWQSVLFLVWEQLMGFSILVVLICIGKKFMDRPSLFTTITGPATFLVFVLHPLVIASLLSAPQLWPAAPAFKFLVIGPLAVAGSFLLAVWLDWLHRPLASI
jgi:hypothetical protein